VIEKFSKSLSAGRIAALFLAMLLGPRANAVQSLSLVWNPSSGNNVAGYQFRYWEEGTTFQYVVDVGTNTSYLATGLQEGQTYNFLITAYTPLGIESLPSNVFTYVVPNFINAALKAGPGSPLLINFLATPGHVYQVQASTDLKTWTTIWQTAVSTSACAQMEDAAIPNLNMRFYRVVWQNEVFSKPPPVIGQLPVNPTTPSGNTNAQTQ
jgi:hypothetical protein